MFPASTTKIMTLLLALESGIPLETEITVPQEAVDIPKDHSHHSHFRGGGAHLRGSALRLHDAFR